MTKTYGIMDDNENEMNITDDNDGEFNQMISEKELVKNDKLEAGTEENIFKEYETDNGVILQYMIQNTIKIIGVKNGFQNDEGYSIRIPENGRVKILMTDRYFSGIYGKYSSLIALF